MSRGCGRAVHQRKGGAGMLNSADQKFADHLAQQLPDGVLRAICKNRVAAG